MSTWISQLKYLRKFRSNIFQLKWDTTTNEKWWFHFKKQSTYTQVLTIYGWKMTTCITQDQKSRERHPADDKSHVFIVCHHSAFFGDWYFYSQWCCWDQSKTWHPTLIRSCISSRRFYSLVFQIFFIINLLSIWTVHVRCGIC